MCVCVLVCVRVSVCLCLCMCMCVCWYVGVCRCLCLCLCMCLCVLVHVHVCMGVHTCKDVCHQTYFSANIFGGNRVFFFFRFYFLFNAKKGKHVTIFGYLIFYIS